MAITLEEAEEGEMVEVLPSGVYTNEPWRLVAPFGSEHKTLIKTYDPRVYPQNESITVAAVDPASEVPVEIAEANTRLIAAAPALLKACQGMQKSLDGSPTNFAGMLAAHRALNAAVNLALNQSQQQTRD